MVGNHPAREHLIALFRQAIATVRADRLAEQALRGECFTHVIALGKAGEALAAGAWRASFPSSSPRPFPSSFPPSPPSSFPPSPLSSFPPSPSSSFPRRRESSLETGLLICSRGYETHELPADAPFERHTGAHPVPDQSSLDAGTALLQFIAALPAPARLAILVSGGTSASVEVPAPGITLDFLRRANRWLLASGLPIDGINHVRAGLSSIKGGGLAQRLKNMRTKVWVLSDIPGKDLNAVGGGLFAAPKDVPWPTVPDWLAQAMRSVPATTEFDLPLERLGGNEEAVAAVAEQGARVWGSLRGEAAGLGAQIGQKLIAAPPGRYVLGGEVTVRLPGDPGRGGRCQQLALAAAVEIAGQEDCFLLAASTDGWDGTDPVAGACVDGGTISRGGKEGFDVRQALRQADAGRFLEASGDLIRTGPTGTHVNDLVIACKRKANSERAS